MLACSIPQLRKPILRAAASQADLHVSELGGGALKGAFNRVIQTGDFEGGCCSTSSTQVDSNSLLLASSSQIAQLGVFGVFENALNNFFGGQLLTVDEFKVLSAGPQRVGPEINIIEFHSTTGNEFHESVVEFSRGRNIFGDSSDLVLEQVAGSIGRELNENVLAIFFRGDQPTRVILETFFNHQDGGAMSDAYKASVEPKLRELTRELGLPDNEIFSN